MQPLTPQPTGPLTGWEFIKLLPLLVCGLLGIPLMLLGWLWPFYVVGHFINKYW
jgi:hypothetical protein